MPRSIERRSNDARLALDGDNQSGKTCQLHPDHRPEEANNPPQGSAAGKSARSNGDLALNGRHSPSSRAAPQKTP
jgi:hypothetical protein